MRVASYQRKEVERLRRYITRPAIANERLSRNSKGQVVLQLKSPYRDGTTHIVMQPQKFMQRLACTAPRTGAGAFAQPRSLTRKHDDGSAAEPTGLLGPRSRDGIKTRLANADSGRSRA